MATLERTYNIPLRKEFMKAPKYRRAKKAMVAVKEFLMKHMKAEKLVIGIHLNKKIWERGTRNPPHHIKVTALKDEKGAVMAELFGAPKPKPKEEKGKKAPEKKPELQKETEELKEALSGELEKEQPASKVEQAEKPAAAPKKAAKKPKAEAKPKTQKE